ncbi:hypothetical protein [Sporolactobacillus sp. THM19-2]|uniref:hypothetical protein n=1 Tax=Sporolactobacillus sp. THM19-2 TaxID=2511171 RepID=UPI001F102ABD|nr:hypothetical protein [Sporolactobacillus sp. THM19-2]
MAGQIRIIPGEWRSFAAKYGQESANTGHMIERLNGRIDQPGRSGRTLQAGRSGISILDFAPLSGKCSSFRMASTGSS